MGRQSSVIVEMDQKSSSPSLIIFPALSSAAVVYDRYCPVSSTFAPLSARRIVLRGLLPGVRRLLSLHADLH